MSIVLDLHTQLKKEDFYSHVAPGEIHIETPLINTSISRLDLKGIIYHRNNEAAKRLPQDYGSLIFIARGNGFWLTSDDIISADGRSLTYIEADQPHIFHMPENYQALSFNFPVHWLKQQTRLELQQGQTLKLTNELKQLLLKASHATPPGITTRCWLENKILELLRKSHISTQANLPLSKLQSIIKTHANNEEFNVEALCEFSGWSKRYVHKVFSGSEITFAEYVIRERLSLAYQEILGKPGSLNNVAIESGFKSQAHFSRRFKQLFKVPPKQISRLVRY